MKLIQIYNKGKPVPGMFAKVSDYDYEWLNKYRWGRTKSHDRYYAWTSFPVVGGIAYMYMHKWILKTKRPVDHKNGDSLDNQRPNLRKCLNGHCNYWNRPKFKTTSGKAPTSKYKGVCFVGGKWLAKITAGKKVYNLGRFDSEEEAAKAYNEAAKKHHGDFAYLNILDK